jgi:hypothetical protein
VFSAEKSSEIYVSTEKVRQIPNFIYSFAHFYFFKRRFEMISTSFVNKFQKSEANFKEFRRVLRYNLNEQNQGATSAELKQ